MAESVYAPEFEIPSGKSIASNRFMMNIASDPYSALEAYAQTMGDLNQARLHSILNGWCDWAYAFEGITETEMLQNAEFASRVLKPYGFEYVQVDEGFQRWHGDWEGNHNILVYVPEAQPWFQGGPFLFHDFQGYTVKMMDDHILRIRVRFDNAGRIPWSINIPVFSCRIEGRKVWRLHAGDGVFNSNFWTTA